MGGYPFLQFFFGKSEQDEMRRDPNAQIGKRRKKRTSIENNVRIALERAFVKNAKPTSEEIKAIGDALSMEKEVVRFYVHHFLCL